MKNIWLMTWFTIREAMARKVFIFFMGISVVAILLATAIFSVIETNSIVEGMMQSGNKMMMKEMVISLELLILSPMTWLCLMLAIFSSASFVPVMLEKGNIDLLLSKPVSRMQLILGKYFGGLLMVFINIAFLVIGVWIIISIKFGYWDANFLLVMFSITFTFAVLYAMIVWFGIMTKSSTPGMMVAYLIFIVLSPLLEFAKDKGEMLIHNDFVNTLIEGFYYLIPKTSELMGKLTISVASGKGIDDFQPVISSFLFLSLMIYLSIAMFNKKDY